MILDVKNLSHSFDNNLAIDDISFEIKKSEVVAISGMSGAGKTTLLNILSTLDKPDMQNNSSLFINNQDVFNSDNNKLSILRNQMIGFVFQFHELIPELNILENVCLPAWIKKDDNAEIKAKELLEYFGLIDFLHKKPSTLSGGEKQRVAIARSLINEPKIIFADEPTGNLDSKNSKILFDLFFKLRDDYNCSVVIVTHNESNANICDRKLMIVDGKIKN